MAEENLKENTEDFTEQEQKAIDMGWNPDEEGLPEGKEFIGAGEYIRNQSWVNEISRLNTKIDSVKTEGAAVIQGLKKNHEIAEKRIYDKAIADLKKEKQEARKEEDVERVIEIDEKIDEIKEEREEAVKAEVSAVPTDIASQKIWKDAADTFYNDPANHWYQEDPNMQAVADSIGMRLSAQHPNNVDLVYKEIVKGVKEAFPAHFENKQRKRPGKVGEPNRGKENDDSKKSTTKSSHKISELPSDVQVMAKEMMNLYEITEQEYLIDYFGE